MDSLRDVVLALHVAGAIAWIGSVLVLTVVGTRVRSRDDHDAAIAFAGRHARFTRAVALPGSLVLLLSGGWLAHDLDLHLGTNWWLGAGIGAWIVAFLGSTMLRGPQLARVVKLAAERGADDEDVRWRTRQVLLVARGELLLLTVALVLMVLQPTT
jgi:hypothetical protein